MIVSEQVEQAMDKEHYDLAIQGMPRLCCLSDGDGNGNDKITQYLRLDMGEASFPERERQDISGLVPAPVSAVQRTHRTISDKEDAQLRVRKADVLQQVREVSREPRRWQLSFPLVVFYPDVHRVSSLP